MFQRLLFLAGLAWTTLSLLSTVLIAGFMATNRGLNQYAILAISLFIACGIVLAAFGAGMTVLGSRDHGFANRLVWMQRLVTSRASMILATLLAIAFWALASFLAAANAIHLAHRPSAAVFDFDFALLIWAIVIKVAAGWFCYAAGAAIWAAKRHDGAALSTRYFGTVLLSFGICWVVLAGGCTVGTELPSMGRELWRAGGMIWPPLSIFFGLCCALIGWALRRSMRAVS